MAATGVLAVFLVGTLLVVALAVVRALSDRAITGGGGAGLGRTDVVALLVALTAICMWLPGVVAAVGELRGRDRPVRQSRFVPSSLRRVVAALVETSLLGAGTLKGWTTTRVDGSLVDLEVPSGPGMPMVDGPHDAEYPDAEDPVGAGVSDGDRSPPVRAPLAARPLKSALSAASVRDDRLPRAAGRHGGDWPSGSSETGAGSPS